MRNKIILSKDVDILKPKKLRYSGIFNITWLVMLLTVFMWQCKKDDFEGETIGICPEVISTDPSDGDLNVTIDKQITATFNEAMDPATFNTNTFTLNKGTTSTKSTSMIEGTVTFSGTKASFTPTVALEAQTIYTCTITSLVRDMAGNSLPENYVWSFTTGNLPDLTRPTVVLTAPINAALLVPLNTVVTANFSETMNGSTLNNTTFLLKKGTESIAGTVSYAGITASFAPTTALLPGTEYTATITTGASDASGNTLATLYTWKFTTFLVIPTITSTSPANLDINVAIDKTITAVFSEAMNIATITTSSFTLKQGSVVIPGVVGFANSTASFNPTSDLMPSTEYTATITMDAKNLAGVAIATNYTWKFTTAGPLTNVPRIISTSPTNLALNVELNKTITAIFSETMDMATVNASSFILKQGLSIIPGVVRYSNVTASFNPTNNLLPSTEYTATITMDAKNIAGDAIATNYTWTFTTGTQLFTGMLPVDLRSAGNFAILAGSGISNTGPTIITGDMGTFPTGTLNGFPPGILNGTGHYADPIAGTAKVDLTTAYNDAQGRNINEIVLPGNLSGLTLTPGLYSNETSVMLSVGNVTLDALGDPNAVFIFQMGSTLTTGSATQVILAGGAKAENIFWAVGSSATLGTTSIFYGTILADQSITLQTGAVLNGRALTRIGAVTLDASIVTKP